MAAYSSHASVIRPSLKQPFCFHLKVGAQKHRYEVKASNMVDGNMRVLRLRMEEMRRRELGERCCRYKHGWNYEAAGYNSKLVKKEMDLSGYVELAGFVGGTFGITCLGGTVCLSLVSVILQNLYQ